MGHCTGFNCGRLYANVMKRAWDMSARNTSLRILAVGVTADPARSSLLAWVSAAGLTTATITYVTDPATLNYTVVNGAVVPSSIVFSAFRIIYVPSSIYQTRGGFTNEMNVALTARQPDLLNYVNVRGGSLIALTQQSITK